MSDKAYKFQHTFPAIRSALYTALTRLEPCASSGHSMAALTSTSTRQTKMCLENNDKT
jgi:hypothetical protein